MKLNSGESTYDKGIKMIDLYACWVFPSKLEKLRVKLILSIFVLIDYRFSAATGRSFSREIVCGSSARKRERQRERARL